jgi:L-threonylcarbamoyladenylate synthase
MTDIQKAKDILNSGEVVAIPTETVYGLAGRIDNLDAINKIFKVKDRPFFDPLIVHVSSIDMAIPLVKDFNHTAQLLAKAFWPGPLAIILEKSEKVSDLITSGLDRVAIRMPNHPIALELIKEVNCPLAAPSANKFKKTSPTSKAHVIDEFNDEVFVLDGGDATIGIESTVVGIFEEKVLIYRPGMITKADIEAVLPEPIKVSYEQSPVAPGQLKHHYMPNKELTVATESFEVTNDYAVWALEDNPTVVARELYSKLRELDKSSRSKILFILKEEFKKSEKWDGILNRIKKAKTHNFYF